MTKKELKQLIKLLTKFNQWKFNGSDKCIQNTSDCVEDTIKNLER